LKRNISRIRFQRKGYHSGSEWFLTFDELPKKEPSFTIQSWDTALKDGEENDYSACLTINVYEDAAGSYEFFVTDIYRGKHIYPELEKQLKLKYEIYTPGVIVIEDAGAGTTLIQNLQGKLHIKGYKPKISKIERFMGTTGYFSDGRIRFQKDIPALEQFKKEIFQFPSGKHDDMVDALMQAVDYIKTQYPRVRIRRL
jgi:predicted phage terminase large subunit-like protein